MPQDESARSFFMNKLIIGCGYLGRRVASLWFAQGHRVWATTRSQVQAREFESQGIQPVLADILDREALRGLPAADTVLFCVGFDRSSGKTMREVYVDGLRNVLEFLPAPKRFIYVSSTSVYGQRDGEFIDESAATEPEEEAGQIVLEAEQTLAEKSLPSVVVLRFAGIYGPGRLLRRKAIEANEPIVADAEKWLNLIHVDDGAAVVLAADEFAPRPFALYNVCDDQPVRRRDFYTRLSQQLGAPVPRFNPPAVGMPLPPHERANRRILNQRVRAELNWAPRYANYEAGLKASL